MSRPKTTITPNPIGPTAIELPNRLLRGRGATDPELLALFQNLANRVAAIDAALATQVGALGGNITTLDGATTSLDTRLDTIENQNLNSRVQTLENNNSLAARAAIFGTGRDGAVSLDGSVAAPNWATKAGSKYILNRDVFLTSLTLTGTAQIITRGFRLYVNSTLNIENAAAGAISYDGSDWADLSSTDRSVGNGGAGGAGGSSPAAGSPAEGSAGVHNGGAGGKGGGGSGQIGGAVVRSALIATPNHPLQILRTSGLVLIGGGGGGGGGQSNATAGAGGNGAGVVAVYAYTIVRGASTPASVIAARGQAGANSSTYGGGGGGGGWVLLVYGILSGSAVTNAISVAGGAGGTGTTANGNAGTAGRITLMNVIAGTMNETSGTATANL